MSIETEGRFYQMQEGVQDRITFVRNVYLWLMGGFAVAGLGAITAYLTLPSLRSLPISGQAFMWILFGAQFGAVLFASAVSRKRPLNMLAYALFTAISGYIAGLISLIVGTTNGYGIVLASAGMTAADFLLLTITVFVTKKDFSFLRSFVIVGVGVMFFGGLVAAIFHLPTFSLVISAVAVIACSAKILWDTSAMLRTSDLSDPAGFALSLFVSLYNIFISLLNLLGGRRN
jgi:modulator of FtsH protease